MASFKRLAGLLMEGQPFPMLKACFHSSNNAPRGFETCQKNLEKGNGACD